MNALAIQAAIFSALQGPLDPLLARAYTADGQLTAQPAIYDHVPQAVDSDGAFPYVVVGDDTSIPFDTDDSIGGETTVTLHIWSRYRGRGETKEIQRAIYDALHRQPLTVAGMHTVDAYYEYAETVLDVDGITRHGIIRFRLIVEEQ